jgi:D-3-phosphoglycerate dehydrogenase
MPQYRIRILNNIAIEGLDLFDSGYITGTDEQNPEGILVRSSQVNTDDYPSLLALARAGAGVFRRPSPSA